MKIKPRKFNLPLFWKFTLAIVLIVFVFGSINAYLIFQDIQKSLESESQKRAMNITKTLVEQSVTPLLFEDYVALQELLDDAKNLDSTVVYAFITDKKHKFVMGSYDLKITPKLIKVNHVIPPKKMNVVQIELNDSHSRKMIRDIALPILGGELGFVRVGISEERINSQVYKTVSHFWFMVGFFLIVGIFGALFFALFITRPIISIQETTDKLSLEFLSSEKVPKIKIRQKIFGVFPFFFRATDEIDLLTDRFNDMISRLHQAYSELENAQKKLIESEKLASIGTLSAGIAHEINNPLSGIQNAIQRIIDNPDKKEQNNNYLKLINQAVGRIEHVVKGLLSFARRDDFNFKYITPKVLLDEVNILIKAKAENNNIKVIQKIDKKIERIYCSSNHIKQVLLNLLLNSIDAINEKDESDGEIVISLRREKPFVKLTIKDNGNGIKEENMHDVFEPFFTTKIKGKGTGLGLAVIHYIISAHNGKVSIESEYGKWTKIDVYLPEDEKCLKM